MNKTECARHHANTLIRLNRADGTRLTDDVIAAYHRDLPADDSAPALVTLRREVLCHSRSYETRTNYETPLPLKRVNDRRFEGEDGSYRYGADARLYLIRTTPKGKWTLTVTVLDDGTQVHRFRGLESFTAAAVLAAAYADTAPSYDKRDAHAVLRAAVVLQYGSPHVLDSFTKCVTNP